MDSQKDLIAYAASVTLHLKESVTASEWKDFIERFFESVVKGVMAEGALVIGHVKGFLELDENNYGYFSTVGTEDGVHYKGELKGEKSIAKLDYNVLLYGLLSEKVSEIALKSLKETGVAIALETLDVMLLNKNKKE